MTRPQNTYMTNPSQQLDTNDVMGIALNFFFHLHISIIGSVVITLVIAVMMGAMRRRKNPSP